MTLSQGCPLTSLDASLSQKPEVQGYKVTGYKFLHIFLHYTSIYIHALNSFSLSVCYLLKQMYTFYAKIPTVPLSLVILVSMSH